MMTMNLSTTDDLLAAVPVLLGFHPHDSAVMVTFGGAHPFHARIDLPPPDLLPEVLTDLGAALLAPARRERPDSVVFVYYSAEAAAVVEVHRHLSRECRADGIVVLDGIRVEGDRWFRAWRVPSAGERGTTFDPAGHRFTAEAVLEGRVTAESREALARRLVGDAALVGAVSVAMGQAEPWPLAQTRDLVEAHIGGRTRPSDAEAATLLLSIGAPQVRAGVWWGLTHAGAERHVELWIDLVRRAPGATVGDAATVLAAVSWLAGNGALAWCAVDRARAVGADNDVLVLIAGLLVGGVPPLERWPDMDEGFDLDLDVEGAPDAEAESAPVAGQGIGW
ncbi:DUF4192 domain-containing protein [Nocardioides sp.]|uniref:DUF4192 domain-containing protein n=1 Tax=Nocardioides sp. TaxID=35761 RepID=UPI0026217CE4|nr:DUF4192 domain-containing protein [Nocardioides sp.]